VSEPLSPASRAVRRVITGQDRSGRSVFVIDEEVEPILSSNGLRYHLIWGTDTVPELPTDGVPNFSYARFPLPGGVRVHVSERPPANSGPQETPGQLPLDNGAIVKMDPETGMHMSNSVDIVFVISGEVGVEQDDGAQVVLRAGDVLVQNGAMHTWRWRGPCRLGFVFVGAHRKA